MANSPGVILKVVVFSVMFDLLIYFSLSILSIYFQFQFTEIYDLCSNQYFTGYLFFYVDFLYFQFRFIEIHERLDNL